MSVDFDMIVVGGGPAGATAAALLAKGGQKVALIDRRRPATPDPDSDFDPRVVAISPGSAAVLEQADAWSRMAKQRLGPYDRMQVHSNRSRILFRASEHGLAKLGWIVELPRLQHALWQSLERIGVELITPATVSGFQQHDRYLKLELDDGRVLKTGLLIAADGARSELRRLSGIATGMWHYNQSALVSHITTERANDGIAWQRFTDHGPLALLPLADGRSSIVWSQPERRIAELRQLDDDAFVAALNQAQDSPFGAALAASPRYAFALIRRQAEQLVRGRLVLLGDAARNVHPLAGQGLNLGLSDAAALAEVFENTGRDDPIHRPLARYERWRLSSAGLVAGGMHAINTLTQASTGRRVTGLGFEMAARLWPLRQAFVATACGLDRDSPRLARSTHS